MLQGDSGGPLLLMLGGVYNQVGIVSFGAVEGCELEYPVGFTRVTSYLNWIETNTGISLSLWTSPQYDGSTLYQEVILVWFAMNMFIN